MNSAGSTEKRKLSAVAVAMLCLVQLGCGDGGTKRYQVSGRITFDGEPVPAGSISFDPDSSQGNRGPGGYAVIEDGRYHTLADRGVVGGPHQVRVSGYDGVAYEVDGEGIIPQGKLLFERTVSVDLPHGSVKQDFDLTAGSDGALSP